MRKGGQGKPHVKVAMSHEEIPMFNFQPFYSNQPGATRAHLLDEDGRDIAFVSFTLGHDDALGPFTRFAATLPFMDAIGRIAAELDLEEAA